MALEYYSHVIDLPPRPPFDKPECAFFSFLGEFVSPVVLLGKHKYYWFTYYGSFARFRIYADDYRNSLRPTIERLYSSLGLTERNEEKGLTLVGDLGHDRFLSSKRNDKKAEDRAELVLAYLHTVAELVRDNLKKRNDGYWELEESMSKENPKGSNFESLHHLFCNMTQVPLYVQMSLWTEWMQPVTGSIKVGY